jgi:hypothetical protein
MTAVSPPKSAHPAAPPPNEPAVKAADLMSESNSAVALARSVTRPLLSLVRVARAS